MEVWGGNQAVDALVSVPGIDAHILSRPHLGDAGGGDIHYLSNCAAGIISRFVLADVSGHGDAVSDLAVTLRSLMRKHINTPDQTRFTRSLNREFGAMAEAGKFATAILATYFAPTDHLIVCNAGHPRPLWYRAGLARWELLHHDSPSVSTRARDAGAFNLPLGVIEPTNYQQFAAPLSPGDLVIFYTDALIEAADCQGRQLGERGLLELAMTMRERDPAALARELLAHIAAHRERTHADDDATVLVLHHNAANPPAQSIQERIRVLGRMLGVMG